jgi:hypothetical protein
LIIAEPVLAEVRVLHRTDADDPRHFVDFLGPNAETAFGDPFVNSLPCALLRFFEQRHQRDHVSARVPRAQWLAVFAEHGAEADVLELDVGA